MTIARAGLHFAAASLLTASLLCHASSAAVLIDDTFNYPDTATMIASGWGVNSLVLFQGGGSIFNRYSFADTTYGSNFINSNPAMQPPPQNGQTVVAFNNASQARNLGVTLTEDFTLTAWVAINGYQRRLQIGLGTVSGALGDAPFDDGRGYSVQWNGASPGQFGGNGWFQVYKQPSWSAFSPQVNPLFASNTQGFTPPTRYALPAAGATDPLQYSPSDTFLGYSEIKLTWSNATDTLEVYQDGNLVSSATDSTYSSFNYLFVGGGTRSYFDRIKLETTQSFGTPGDFNADNAVDGADLLVWQRGDAPTTGSPAELALWQAHFGEGASVGALAAVPEPATASLFAAAVVGLQSVARRRVRRATVCL